MPNEKEETYGYASKKTKETGQKGTKKNPKGGEEGNYYRSHKGHPHAGHNDRAGGGILVSIVESATSPTTLNTYQTAVQNQRSTKHGRIPQNHKRSGG